MQTDLLFGPKQHSTRERTFLPTSKNLSFSRYACDDPYHTKMLGDSKQEFAKITTQELRARSPDSSPKAAAAKHGGAAGGMLLSSPNRTLLPPDKLDDILTGYEDPVRRKDGWAAWMKMVEMLRAAFFSQMQNSHANFSQTLGLW